MDILNFISWIAGKKRVVTSVPDNALIPVGIRTETRDDKYTTVVIKKSDLISSGFKYEIGQYVADKGGVIFHRYLEGGNENYLVVALTDQSTSEAWSNINNVLIGSTAQSLWNGLSNSTAIVGQVGETSSAAALCLNYAVGPINDWYLPSIQEINKLWNNYLEVSKTLSQTTGATQLQPTYYWSSTEYSNDSAWYFYFYYGEAANYLKSFAYYVRAIRKFSIPI